MIAHDSQNRATCGCTRCTQKREAREDPNWSPPTESIGYAGTKYPDSILDPSGWVKKRDPDLKVMCSRAHRVGRGESQLIAKLWRDLEGEYWYEDSQSTGIRKVAEWADLRPGHLPMFCSVHGAVFAPMESLLEDLHSTRRTCRLDCVDPRADVIL